MAICALFISVPGVAHACSGPFADRPYFHETLPPMSEGMVAAEVEILTERPRKVSLPLLITARVIRMVHGSYAGHLLRIEQQVVTSCDAIPTAGGQGIVVGRVLPSSDGALTIEPMLAPSELERERRKQGASKAH